MCHDIGNDPGWLPVRAMVGWEAKMAVPALGFFVRTASKMKTFFVLGPDHQEHVIEDR